MSKIQLPHNHGEHKNLSSMQMHLNNNNNFQIIADIFKQLGDTTRIRIFWFLCHYEECVFNIAAILDMSSPAVSHHLKLLKNSNLISCRREGKEVYYKASRTPECNLLHKMIEQVMKITCPFEDFITEDSPEEYQEDPLTTVHKIHDYLTMHIDQRVTVEELAKQFLMNPTTLKTLFKKTYGNSIASHIKEHRMTRAAELLTHTDMSLAEISNKIGYTSQSKFTAAFKEYYNELPKDFRRKQQLKQ